MRRDNPFIRTRCRCRLKAARLPLINRGRRRRRGSDVGESGGSHSLAKSRSLCCVSPSRTAERKMLKLAGNNGRRFPLSGRDGLGGIPIKSNWAHFKTVLVTLLFHPKSSFGAFCSLFFSHGCMIFSTLRFTYFALAPTTIYHETCSLLATAVHRPERHNLFVFHRVGTWHGSALRRCRCSTDPLLSARPAHSSGLGATLDG